MRLIRGIITLIVLVGIGGFFTVTSIRDKTEFANRKDFAAMETKDFRAGQFVTGEIDELWEEFAFADETYTDPDDDTKTTTTKYYFILPLKSTLYGDEDDKRFIAAVIKSPIDLEKARKLVRETNDWYDYDEPITAVMNADGKISKMDSAVHDALLKFLEERGYDDTHIIRYELHIGENAGSATILLILGLVLLVIGLLIFAFDVLKIIFAIRHQ